MKNLCKLGKDNLDTPRCTRGFVRLGGCSGSLVR